MTIKIENKTSHSRDEQTTLPPHDLADTRDALAKTTLAPEEQRAISEALAFRMNPEEINDQFRESLRALRRPAIKAA